MAKPGNKLFHKACEFIGRHLLVDDASGVVVGVSGGADSVALLDILVRLRARLAKTGQQKPWHIQVAHLNHLLRGKESDADAEFVCRLAQGYGVNLATDSADVFAIARAAGKGIEETARELRYRFFVKVALESGCNRIATGHTMNDQSETFVMRLARGAGLRGLAAMRPAILIHSFDPMIAAEKGGHHPEAETSAAAEKDENRPNPAASIGTGAAFITPSPHHPTTPALLLIRPLLGVTREEVEAYCRERQLDFRSDASNDSLRYTRNRVRHETLNALRALNPKVVEHIAQTAELIEGEEDALREAAQIFLKQSQVGAKSWRSQSDPKSSANAYAIAALLDYGAGLRRRLLVEAIRQARKQAPQGKAPRSEITLAHVEAIERLLQEGSSGRRLTLPDGLTVWREFDTLVFVYEARPQGGRAQDFADTQAPETASEAAAKEASYTCFISSARPVLEVAGLKISLFRQQPISALPEILAQARLEKAGSGRDWKVVALDDDLVPDNLVLRPRQAGEMVLVIGQRKIIKLKKLMIDHKIAPGRRASWPVFVTLDGDYVWSPGLPPALKFAARDKTRSLAILRASDV